MDLKSVTSYKFVPTAGGNLKQEKPVTFVCQYLTSSEMADVTTNRVVVANGESEVQIVVNKDALVKKGLIEVEGMTLAGEAITTAEQFVSVRHPIANQWFNELSNNMIMVSNQEEDVLKN